MKDLQIFYCSRCETLIVQLYCQPEYGNSTNVWCTMSSLYILFLYHKLLVSTMRKFYQGFKCTRVRNVYKMSKCIFGVKTAAHITSLVYVRPRINMFYTHSSLSYTIMQIDLYDSVLAGIQVASSPTVHLLFACAHDTSWISLQDPDTSVQTVTGI